MKHSRRQFLQLPILATLQFYISSCGFHPRGSLTRTTDTGSVFVDAETNLSITEEVKEALADAGFSLTSIRDAANILLRLTNESEVQRVVSVTSGGRISELELIHSVNMGIVVSEIGSSALYSDEQRVNRVEVTREYTYDETGVLGKENEARILREEMKRDLVKQIVLRSIASLAPLVAS